ncbi:MAG: sigma-54-dependent Fis family transcriptional regulator, partial [Candidatus Cloacimonetes bacterium]|nr:sigma-54-dependent Fis family transcriptional regulator [Candidatus Cloacimonadota bacterium]
VATNKNLFDEIQQGRFRKDLFFRLNINSIYLHPLRERQGDISLLTDYFFRLYSLKYKKKLESISLPVRKLLNGYSFPGNVRELMNIINSTIIVESSKEIRKASLPHYFLENASVQKSVGETFNLKTLQEVEKEHIRQTMISLGWNKTKAAKSLGISRVNLIAKIKKYELE